MIYVWFPRSSPYSLLMCASRLFILKLCFCGVLLCRLEAAELIERQEGCYCCRGWVAWLHCGLITTKQRWRTRKKNKAKSLRLINARHILLFSLGLKVRPTSKYDFFSHCTVFLFLHLQTECVLAKLFNMRKI